MEEILKDIGSPYWWIGVVLVGIAINVASHYLQKALDRQLSSVSSWWRERSEAQKTQRLKDLERLRDNLQAQTFTMVNAITYLLLGIAFIVLSGMMLGFVVLVLRPIFEQFYPIIVSPMIATGMLGAAIFAFNAFRLIWWKAVYELQLVRESRTISALGDDTKIGLRVNVPQEGLGILCGIYGAKGQYRDVTQRLNELMKGERLKITVNNPTLVGDDDPIEGVGKDLVVLYSYDGQIGFITKHEHKGLLLPEITL